MSMPVVPSNSDFLPHRIEWANEWHWRTKTKYICIKRFRRDLSKRRDNEWPLETAGGRKMWDYNQHQRSYVNVMCVCVCDLHVTSDTKTKFARLNSHFYDYYYFRSLGRIVPANRIRQCHCCRQRHRHWKKNPPNTGYTIRMPVALKRIRTAHTKSTFLSFGTHSSSLFHFIFISTIFCCWTFFLIPGGCWLLLLYLCISFLVSTFRQCHIRYYILQLRTTFGRNISRNICSAPFGSVCMGYVTAQTHHSLQQTNNNLLDTKWQRTVVFHAL